MKKIALVTAIIFLIGSCGTTEKKQDDFENKSKESKAQTETQNEECLPGKYSLCDKEQNYFYFKEDKVWVKLNIPVTSNDLELDTLRSISTESINAILVHLKGGEKCTPQTPIKKFITVDEPVEELNRYSTRMRDHDKLLVYIFNDQSGIEITKIQGINDYKFAKDKIRRESKCPSVNLDEPLQPKEQDGDVIGGNQKL
ncbi:hypothetical protein PY092_12655 [Muricauda sp. 334s03]|uniref:Lipoprotein n=1 Tax=Flagellimonas yonaguniensis TaxID=3031325 RepID=A0ABT5Y0N1_9FLAO|nr:hypothetical protein [[Muricauda] yonaguniensis]MDF0717005.1 hypothetical protein [[Muricauda] yonaguniensis]